MKPQSLDDAMRSALKSSATVRIPPPLVSTRFEIGPELGRGGTSVVYAAFDRKLGREVAVKVLREESRGDAEMAIRFRREAETAAKLSHPGIVTVFDVGWESGRMILVMERVRGVSMADALAAKSIPGRKLVEILESTSRAVDYAHRSGVIHRDLKPGNILIATDGTAKVADFGLARRMDSQTQLTASGTTLGTPGYMAPEQAMGKSALFSARTDVYALGAILYHILTGRPPHEGENPADVIRRIAFDDPPTPRSLNASAAPDLELVALRALEKDPARRYPDAASFADELRRHLNGSRVQARPPGFRRRSERWIRRHLALAAAGAVVALALSAFGILLAVNAVQKARRVAQLAADVKAATSPDAAADLCAQLKLLDPLYPGVDELLASLRAAAKRKKAEELTRQGAAAVARTRQLETELGHLRESRSKLFETLDAWEKSGRRQELWAMDRRIAALEGDLSEQLTLAVSLHAMAVEIDTTYSEPRSFLSDTYWEHFLKAEWAGDVLGMAEARGLLRLHDPARAKQCDEARGSALIDSSPPGAAIELFRFEEAEDRRLVPAPARDPMTDLAAGSYLAVLRLQGRQETRFQFAITRRHPVVRATVRLLREGALGEGFVHVPAGSSIIGAADRREMIVLPDLVVGRDELTCREYGEWLTVLLERGETRELKEALPLKGWEVSGDKVEFKGAGGPGMPVTHVSWKQAREYCRWRAERDGWGWRLPTAQEREALVRGADARPYPWGHSFDWAWTNGGRSQPEPGTRAAGATPEDVNPAGLRDLAGNVKEWCSGWQDKKAKLRAIRGGGWGDTDWGDFLAFAPDGDPPDEQDEEVGFRIVRALDERD